MGGTTGLGTAGTFVASREARGPGRAARIAVTFLVLLLVIMGLPPLPFAIGGDSPVRVAIVADPPGPTAPGAAISYTVYVQNEGHETQTGVQISVPVPEGTTLVEGSTQVSVNPAVIALVADDFESGTLDGSAGLNPWLGAWTPSGDPSNARVLADDEAGSSVLSVGSPTTAATRTVDLSGFPAAYLTYRYKRINLPGTARFAVEMARAGDESFARIDELEGAGSSFTEPIYQTQTIDITRFISPASAIRFATDGVDLPDGAGFRIDQVTITSIPPAGTTGPHPQVASGFTLLPGDELTVGYQVTVNEELGEQTEFLAEVSVVSAEDPDPRRAESAVELNQPPTAVDDGAETAPGQPVTIDVLANDTDPNQEPLTVAELGDPANGTATDNEDGTVTYQPADGFAGSDLFMYRIVDGLGESAGATVSVTVTEPVVPASTIATPVTPAAAPPGSPPLDSSNPPLTFERNMGQIDPAFDFVAQGRGYTVTLAGGGTILSLGNGNSPHEMRMSFAGATANPEIMLWDTLSERSADGHPLYASVGYAGVYPGIDVVYSADGRELEYSFTVHPGAHPGAIALAFTGANNLTIRDDGSLLIDRRGGKDLHATAPYTYQDIEGIRSTVESSYLLNGDGTVGFAVGAYDPDFPLVIDPTFRTADTSSGDSTSVVVSLPAGVQQGDVLVAQIARDKDTAAVTPPAGWVLIREDTFVSKIVQALFYKVAGPSEPADFTFTLSEASKFSAAIAAYSGVDTTDPIDAHSGTDIAAGDPFTAPSITTTVADVTLVAFFANLGPDPVTPPSGMTERWDFGGDVAIASADEAFVGPGATGDRTASFVNSEKMAQLIALAPAPVGSVGDAYLLAGTGGANGGDDLLTIVDPTDANAATNEVTVGLGTGTTTIKTLAAQPGTGTLFAAAGGQLGTISQSTGVWSAVGSFGSAAGALGSVVIDDVNALTFDSATNFLYGVQNRAGAEDLLFRADPATGVVVPNAFGFGVDYVVIQGVGARDEVSAIAVHPSTGVMYAGQGDDGGGQNQRLVTIDKTSGATSTVGDTDPPILTGLGFDESGNLWGTGYQRSAPASQFVYRVSTADASILASIPIDNGGSYQAISFIPPYTNQPPVFDQDLSDRTDAEASWISLPSAATDPDVGDTLTYSVTVLPLGLAMDTGTGLITGLINYYAAASSPYSVEITVCDDGVPVECDIDTFTWTINDKLTTDPYVVADTGGANGGDDLLTEVNPLDLDPVTNEVDIGTGTGTTTLRGLAIEPISGVLYGAAGDRLGTLDTDSGVFTMVGGVFGSGNGDNGIVTFDNVVGLAFHPLTGELFALHHVAADRDLLFSVDPVTGAAIPGTFHAGRDYVELGDTAPLEATDIAIDPTDWAVYGIFTDGAGSFELRVINDWNGATSKVGNVTPEIRGLTVQSTGQMWGTDAAALYEIDKTSGAAASPRMLDNGSQYGAVALAVPPAFPPAVEGTVFEDVSGNGVPAGEFVQDYLNPGVGGVTMRLYVDDGLVPGQPDAGDTLWANKLTGPTGHYFFSSIPAGTYWLTADSSDVSPIAGGAGWAEQTYGPAEAVTFDGSYSFAGAPGPLYGGMRPTTSDNASSLTSAEHVVRVDLSPGEVIEQVDLGFSFNVVTNLEGGDGTSPQGSLRQFFNNANSGTGSNMMRFTPAVPTNASLLGDQWWSIPVTVVLPALVDSATTVDGIAYDSNDGITVLNTNSQGPELELDGTGTGATDDGLTVNGGTSTIGNLVVNRFGDDGISGSANDVTIAGTYVGTNATGTFGAGNAGDGIQADGNNWIIGGSAAAERNVVSGNGDDGIKLFGTSHTVEGNYLGTNAAGDTPVANGDDGVEISSTSSGNTVGGSALGAGNLISGNAGNGVRIDLSGNNDVIGNTIGLHISGSVELGNGNNGIFIVNGPGNQIGGINPADRNVVSGNGNNGILLDGAASSGNIIQGNYVGLNVAGTSAVPNADDGVDLSDAPGNTVGGSLVGSRNVISGNGQDGLLLIGNGTTGNNIVANYLGTNAVGDAPVPNGRAGVYIDNGANGNTIGGGNYPRGNLISGNTEDGVYITDSGSNGNTLASNFIGTNAAGDAAIPNGDRGVQVEMGASGNFVGVSGSGNVISGNSGDGVIIADFTLAGTTDNEVVDNLIGVAVDGTSPLPNGANGVHLDPVANTLISGNTIAHNGADGVILEAATLTGNSIIGNSIHSNGQLGIDLGNDGVTPNDLIPGDGDSGPNDLLNFPVITSATETAGTVTVDFDLDVPDGTYRVEFFTNTAADASGFGEGETLVGSVDVSVTGGVPTPGSHSFAGSEGEIITATATEGTSVPFGSTSEFSAAATVASGAFVVNSTGNSGDNNLGNGVCYTGNNFGAGIPECTLRAAIQEANALAGADAIAFNIPVGDGGHSGGVWTITPGSLLPTISTTIIIDGTTQPGWTSTPVIELNGTSAGGTADGFTVTGDNCEIRGLAINRFGDDGINVDAGASGLVIAGNHIGTNASGLLDRGNGGSGIDLGTGSGPTLVGGTDAADRNIISGNGSDGVIIFESDGNTVIGNYIGTDLTGNAPLPNAADGIALGSTSSNNTIGQPGWGNVLSGNDHDGLELDNDLTGNIVQSNIIGLGADGTTPVPNGRHGLVLYDGVNNTLVGGTGAGEGNVISANTESGVVIDGNGGVTTTANTFEGNFIGTDITGALNRGNGTNGIHLFAGANGNTIGGTAAGARNIISASTDYGIEITGAGTDSNDVIGNYIGTDAAGTVDRGNGSDGVAIRSGAQSNTIGGTTAAHRNVISGNDNDGVWITGSGTSLNTVQGNWIGVAANGTPMGNLYHGVAVEFEASDNLVGGAAVGAGNRIENNAWDGIAFNGGNGTGNAALRNSISDNTGLGIDINNDGVTPNDVAPGDPDSGPNDLLNFPVITSATETAGIVTVGFDLDVPDGNYRIEFFDNTAADPSGNGEGETFVSAVDVSVTGGVPTPASHTFSGSAGDIITATTTEGTSLPFGSTSEFSAAITVLLGSLVVNSTGEADDLVAGDGVCDTGGTVGADAECTLDAAIQEANAWAGPNNIHFAIPDTDTGYRNLGAGLSYWKIEPSDAITPILGDDTTIDATTQTAYAVGQGFFVNATGPEVEINGSVVGAGNGLEIQSSNNEIRGFVINRFVTGIAVLGGDGNVIAGNYLGPDPSGAVGLVGNTGEGLEVDGATNTLIGGSALADRNVISGNRQRGIAIDTDSPVTAGTQIIGNYIGTNATGNAALPYDASADQQIGVYILNSPDTIVGTAAAGNLISGNSWFGIYGWGTSATGTVIQGNVLGLDAAQTAPVPNATDLAGGRAGIYLSSISGALIGGDSGGQGNIIAENGEYGVILSGATAAGNTIIGNQIYGNADLGIDLGGDGVTLNDLISGDPDSGPNDLLNFPVITSATETAGTVTVDFDLDVPDGNYRIEFFDNTAADPSGYGEGETLVGSVDVSVTGGVPTPASHVFSGSAGDIITATTTEGTSVPFGSTSEFSAAFVVTLANQGPVFDQDLLDRVDAEATWISLSSGATDPDAGDTLTYSATGLPLGLSIDSGTGLISGLVNYRAAFSSPYSTEITVCDDGAPIECDSDVFTWTITNVPTTDPYAVANTGGGNGGDDLLTEVDPLNFDPVTNEVDIGTGTGTVNLHGLAIEPISGVLYAADGDRLGVLNVDSGVFTPVGGPFGSGDGDQGTVTYDDVRGLTFQPLTGRLFAVHHQASDRDVLFVVDTATGLAVPNVFAGSRDYVEFGSGAPLEITDITLDPTSWQLYGAFTDGAGSFELRRINRWNGATNVVGALTPEIRGLSFDSTGQMWGADGGALYEISKTTAAATNPRTLDNGADYQAVALAIPPFFPPSIEGTIFEDISGNAVPAGEFVGDFLNPGFAGATLRMYRDNGSVPGEPDAADTLYASKTTGPGGHYFFSSVPAGVYWLTVDSSTLVPTAGGTGWAEQTYGPDEAVSFSGSYSFAATAGPLYGGMRPTVSDNATLLPSSEHVVRVDLSPGEEIEQADVGFSFNVVTNLEGGDGTSPQGSLRQLISNANTGTGPNAMRFVPAVPSNASQVADQWWSVPVTVALPALVDALTTIDGTAYDSNDGIAVLDTNTLGPELELNGTGTAATADGLRITGGTTTVSDLVINRFGRDGIRITTAGGNTIAGSYLGTNATGTADLGNGNNGIFISSAPGNTIGGLTAALRNVISGNNNNGLLIDGPASTGNLIQGNYVGTNAAGDAPVPNADDGVDLSDAPGNTVGGTAPGSRNVISGNGQDGLLLIGNQTTGNSVFGNHLGTNAAGDAPVPNGRAGIYVDDGAFSNTVGGATSDHRNVISGNTEDGVYITDPGSDGNTLAGNYVGTNAAGDAAIPNGDRGVQVEMGASGNFVGVSGSGNVISGNTGDGVIIADFTLAGTTDNEVVDNLIGVAADGTSPLPNGANGVHLDPVAGTLISGNVIAFNGADGVILEAATLTGNSIIGNSIYSNGQLGIDLGNDGVTPNDVAPGDSDTGPNDLLNFPVIISAVEVAGTVSLDFDLDVPAGDYRIEFFVNAAADGSGYGEGESLVHSYDVVGHPGGSVPYSTSFAGSAGDIITATSTEETAAPYGSTSEFSASYTCTSPNSPPVLNPVGDQSGDELALLTFTASASDVDVPANTLTYSLSGEPAGAAIDPVTGVFTWTPTEAQGPNSYTFDVVVTDDGTPVLNDFESITVTVNEVNVAPVLGAVGDQSVDELVLLTFTASASDADVPANTLTYSLTGEPAGAAIDPVTGVFTWTPTEAQDGIHTFDVVVTDNGTPNLNDTETIAVTVNEANLAPVLGAVGDQTVDEQTLLSFTATATDADLPANTLTFSLSGEPAGALIDPVSGVFTWTPSEAQGPNTYAFSVNVSDGVGGNDSESITVTVNEANVAPVLGAIGNQSVDEQTLLTFTATATDADLPANTLTFSLSSEPAGAAIDPNTGVFTWTPTETQGPGLYTFDVVVSDGTVPDSETITVTVNETNVAPVVTNPGDQTDPEGTVVNLPIAATDADLPANTLGYSAAGLPPGLSIDPVSGVISGTVSFGCDTGSPYAVTVTVTDDGAPNLAGNTVFGWDCPNTNRPPVLDPVGDQSGDELTLITFTATAADPDAGDSLSFSLSGEPVGASIDPVSGVFTWTPTEAQGPGSYTFSVVVTDDGTPVLNDSETITVTVNEVDTAPVLNPIANQPGTEGSSTSFTASAVDPDVPSTLTFTLVDGPVDPVPAGAAIDPVTGTFFWVPTEAQGPGVYEFYIRVTDNTALFDQELVTFTISEWNEAPVLDPIGDQTTDEQTLLTFTASASDADVPANTLTYSLSGEPAGASIDPVTGVFTWTPTEAQGPNSHTFDVVVTDNGTPVRSDSETITVTVNEVNVAPVLGAVGDQSVDEQTLLTFTATATDVDLPANTLTFSLSGEPVGASIDPVTGVFTWTPTEAQDGIHTFDVVVTDDGTPNLSDTESITVTVNEVNVAPVLTPIGNQSVDEQTLLTFTATATDADLPANTLTFSLSGEPVGASIDPNTGVFTWTPSEAQGPGSYTFDVIVTDDGTPNLSDTESITVTVNEVNVAPVVTNPGDQTDAEGTVVNLPIVATDADVPANGLSYGAAGLPPGLSIDLVSGVISGTVAFGCDAGSPHTVTVTVTDNGTPNLAGTALFDWYCPDTNRPPTLDPVGDHSVDELVLLSFTATASDPDAGDILLFSLSGEPVGALIDPVSGVFTWTPSEAQGPGSYTFSVVVTDDGTPVLNDSESITVTVNDVNVAPVLAAIGNQTIDEQTLLTFTASATDADVPANALLFSLSGEPAGASIDPNSGVFTWTPTEAQGPNSYTFDVVVTDNGIPVLNDSESITVTVNEVNVAPVLAAIGNQTVDEETLLTFTASATDADVPANGLLFSLVGEPAGASIDPNSGVFSWTPTEAQGPGPYTFSVVVTDDGTPNLADSESITVTVNEVNVAPVLAAIGNQTIDEQTVLTFTASATDADVPANGLLFGLSGEPVGASIDPNSGVFTWTPTETQGPGSYTFDVNVVDGVGGSDSESITVTVNEVNVAPVLAAIGNQTVDEQTVLTFTASATDADLPANGLLFSLSGEPAGASIDPNSGAFTWTPTEAQGPGPYTFSVVVTDDGTPVLNDSESITVTVNEVNVPPVLAAIGNQTVDEQTLLTFTASATDADLPTNSLLFSLSGQPAGALIDPVSGVFTWTPAESQGPGSYAFDVNVIDGVGGSDSETITVTVNEINVAPILNPIGNQTVDEQVLLTFTATATDADLPATGLTFSLAGEPAGASIDPVSGVFTWTPSETQGPGVFTLDVTVADGGAPAGSDSETITITVNETNVAPVVANPGDQTSTENDPITLTITATDTDVPVNTLTWSATGLPDGLAIGPLTGTIGGTISYDAAGGSPHVVTATATDNGTPNLANSVVFVWNVIDLNRPPIALDDAGSVPEDLIVTIDVLGNDSDPDLDALAVSGVTQGIRGSVTNNGTDVTYMPDLDWNGTDTFTYTATDGRGGFNTATVTIVVTPVNDNPVAGDDAATAVEDVASIVNVLTNDTDIDGDPLTVISVTQGGNGSVTTNGTTVSYLPDLNWNGTDTFTYDVADGNGGIDTAVVSITVVPVNDAPVAVNDAIALNEDGSGSVSVLTNDFDVDGDPLNLVGHTNPVNGTLTHVGGGVFVYSPDANFNGVDTFTYTAGDGTLTAGATVTLTVASINDAPVAAPDSYAMVGDTVLDTSGAGLAGVLANDSDVEGDPLSAVLDGGPGQGTLVLASAGSFVYTPNPGWFGTDTFTYRAFDGAAGSVPVNVQIVVDRPNQAPVAANDQYSVGEGDTLVVGAPGVLGNDSDPDADLLTAALVTPPTRGTLTLAASGSFVYTHTAESAADDSFTYVATDSRGATSVAVVIIRVIENLAPVVVADLISIDEDTVGSVDALANDLDPEGESLTIVGIEQPLNGIVTLEADGTLSFAPAPNWFGTTRFAYLAGDGRKSSRALVTVFVASVNDLPVGGRDSYRLTHYGPAALDVLANDTDVDGDVLSVVSINGVEHALAEVADGALVYNAHAEWLGTETFTYTLSDGHGGEAEVVVSVTMADEALDAANTLAGEVGAPDVPFDAPEASGDVVPISLGTPRGVSLLAGAFFDSFEALKLPLGFLLIALLWALIFGGLFSSPWFLFGGRRRFWSIVLVDRESMVSVHAAPDFEAATVYNYPPTTQNIMSTGAPKRKGNTVWMPVDTPNGEGWIDAYYLTQEVDDQTFANDKRPPQLAANFVKALTAGNDRALRKLVSARGLAAVRFGKPVVVPMNRLKALLSTDKEPGWWRADPLTAMEALFPERLAEPFLSSYWAGNQPEQPGKVATLLVPAEVRNFHRFTYSNAEGTWWLLFEYHKNKPFIAGIALAE